MSTPKQAVVTGWRQPACLLAIAATLGSSDASRAAAVSYWAVGDNLRKGAATNSVQIAEVMFRR